MYKFSVVENASFVIPKKILVRHIGKVGMVSKLGTIGRNFLSYGPQSTFILK